MNDKPHYCPDCGSVLFNPKKCNCGWKFSTREENNGKPYSECCMSAGCKQTTDVVIQVNGNFITRCAWHYTQDLRRANKQQMKLEAI